MQMSGIGSAPAEDWGGGGRREDGLSLRLGHRWVGAGGGWARRPG